MQGKKEAQTGDRRGAPSGNQASLAGGGEGRVYLEHCSPAQDSRKSSGPWAKENLPSQLGPYPELPRPIGLTGHTPFTHTPSVLSRPFTSLNVGTIPTAAFNSDNTLILLLGTSFHALCQLQKPGSAYPSLLYLIPDTWPFIVPTQPHHPLGRTESPPQPIS